MEKVNALVITKDKNNQMQVTLFIFSRGEIELLKEYDNNGGYLTDGDGMKYGSAHLSLFSNTYEVVRKIKIGSRQGYELTKNGKLAILELKKMRKIK
jgi:hypothetical protein